MVLVGDAPGGRTCCTGNDSHKEKVKNVADHPSGFSCSRHGSNEAMMTFCRLIQDGYWIADSRRRLPKKLTNEMRFVVLTNDLLGAFVV
jgi:hypothetical protein